MLLNSETLKIPSTFKKSPNKLQQNVFPLQIGEYRVQPITVIIVLLSLPRVNLCSWNRGSEF